MRRASQLSLSLALLAACSEPAPSSDDAARTPDAAQRDASGLDAPASDAPGLDASSSSGDAAADASVIEGEDAPVVAACVLTASGPLVIDTDDAVIERLDVTSDGGPAIRVNADRVTIRDVRIRHRGGVGIFIAGADDVVVERVDIENVGVPTSGAASSADQNNLESNGAARLTVRHARLTRGSSGVYLVDSPGSRLEDLEGHDFRGPFPRGQLVQWNRSDDGVLEGFSVVNPASSWPEDNVNVYQSTGIVIRDGLVDGNNSPSGVGVIFDDGGAGLVEDVDALHMGNGCFSNFVGPAGNVFRRTRCRDNVCTDQGRGLPSSNALMWHGNPSGAQARVESSSWWASCNGNVSWPSEGFEVLELEEEEFTPRAPREVVFCFGR
ncbi:MAG: right-handed parallel beta-helix repeat-containing protein [Deltaproteobacteria bacterium]|nr:right-handed parallel beta-helix repeat-containing protein [Deltaproteobacteria bacterium]